MLEEEEQHCQSVCVFVCCYLKIYNNLGNPELINEKGNPELINEKDDKL
jgi:hypothetical protein